MTMQQEGRRTTMSTVGATIGTSIETQASEQTKTEKFRRSPLFSREDFNLIRSICTLISKRPEEFIADAAVAHANMLKGRFHTSANGQKSRG